MSFLMGGLGSSPFDFTQQQPISQDPGEPGGQGGGLTRNNFLRALASAGAGAAFPSFGLPFFGLQFLFDRFGRRNAQQQQQ